MVSAYSVIESTMLIIRNQYGHGAAILKYMIQLCSFFNRSMQQYQDILIPFEYSNFNPERKRTSMLFLLFYNILISFQIFKITSGESCGATQ